MSYPQRADRHRGNTMGKAKKENTDAPLDGDVTPTDKTYNVVQPVYSRTYTEGKAPSNRETPHGTNRPTPRNDMKNG